MRSNVKAVVYHSKFMASVFNLPLPGNTDFIAKTHNTEY